MSILKSEKKRSWFVDFNVKRANCVLSYWYEMLFLNRIAFGIKQKTKPRNFDIAHKQVEKFLAKTGATINHHLKDKFFVTYIPEFSSFFSLSVPKYTHEIFLPDPCLFDGEFESRQKYYYFTLMHELIHWTGSEFHLKRFTRDTLLKKDAFLYAYEELVAGYGSLFLMMKFNLLDTDIQKRVSAYLADYMKVIIAELLESGEIPGIEGNSEVDYIKLNPTIQNLMSLAEQDAKDAIKYLETNFEKSIELL